VALLATGQLVSGFGDNILAIALMWIAGSPGQPNWVLPAVGVLRVVPLILAAPAGVYADRWGRQATLFWADMMRAGLLLLALADSGQVWAILAMFLAVQVVGSIYSPALSALLPSLVPASELVSAEGLVQGLVSVAQLGGVLLGGVLISLVAVPGVIGSDLVSFLLSGVSVTLLRPPTSRDTPGPDRVLLPAAAESTREGYWQEFVAGLRTLRRLPLVTTLVLADSLVNVAFAPLGILLVAWSRHVLHGSSLDYGALAAAIYAGLLVGGLTAGWVTARAGMYRVLVFAPVAMALCVATVGVASTFPVGLAALALFGLAGGWSNATVGGWLALTVPEEYRARIFGVLGSTLTLTTPVGIFIFGSLLLVTNVSALFLGVGAISATSSLILLWSRTRQGHLWIGGAASLDR
jgi:DHA3 family macrolide efflux protein-like MFS transporter